MASVMVVDDAQFMRQVVSSFLTKMGHTVVGEADNGAVAMEKYQTLKPDLVLMDITMPEVDGIEAVRLIRTFDPSARIVMCTAMNQEFVLKEALQAGAMDYLIKPVQFQQMEDVVSKVLFR